MIDVPVPITFPLQESSYQVYCPPVPADPPFTVSVTLDPGQTGDAEAVAETGSIERVFTFTVTLTQAELPHDPPSALTK